MKFWGKSQHDPSTALAGLGSRLQRKTHVQWFKGKGITQYREHGTMYRGTRLCPWSCRRTFLYRGKMLHFQIYIVLERELQTL